MFSVTIHQCRNRKFSITSKLIEMDQNTNYSHYGIEYLSESGNSLAVDSTRKNISTYKADKYFSEKYDRMESFTFNFDCKRREFLKWMEEHLGKDYPEKQIFNIFVGKLLFKNGKAKLTCNELVIDMLETFIPHYKFVGTKDMMDLNSTTEEIKRLVTNE